MSLITNSTINGLFPTQFRNLNDTILSGLGSIPSSLKGFDFLSSKETKNVTKCEITAWLDPGHGFVQFDCGALQDIIGMYPGIADVRKRTSRQSALGSKCKSISSTSGATSSLISAEALLFSFGARVNAAARGLWVNPLAFFKYKSFHGGMHSANSAATKNLSGMKFKYWGDRFPAIIADDSGSYEICQSSSCKYSTVQVSEERALKIYEYANKTPDSYHIFGGNCIDYLIRVMDKTKRDWKNQFAHTQPPSLNQRIFGIAWQYFKWRVQEY